MGPHLYCTCSDVDIDPYWNFHLASRPWGQTREFAGTLFPSSQRGHIEYISFSYLAVLIWLFQLVYWAWIARPGLGHSRVLSLKFENNTLKQSVTDISQWKPPYSWAQMCGPIFLLSLLYIWEWSLYLGTSQEGERRFMCWGHWSQVGTMERLIRFF